MVLELTDYTRYTFIVLYYIISDTGKYIRYSIVVEYCLRNRS